MSDIRLPLLKEHGVTHEWVDHGDGKITVHSYQDVEPILDANKAMANENDGYNKARDMRRLASIPTIVMMQWLNELMGDPLKPAMTFQQAMATLRDPAFIKKKLDDPSWKYLRTSNFVRGA